MAKKESSLFARLVQFISVDIWRIRTNRLPRTKSLLIKQLRILLLSIRGFDEDKCQLRASALTFYSLLSIVPVVAMAFGIAKGFGFENVLENQLLQKFPGQQDVITQIINFARSMLENTKGGVVAGIGVAILFWTVIKVLGNIENSFNDIWGIKKGRSIGRKFSDYLSIMLICPILFIMSSSVTVMITSQVKVIVEKIALLGALSPLIMALLKLLPYAVIWIMFTFIYVFMPNTKVNFKAGLFGGIIAGTIYQIVQWAYITFQIGASRFGAIYGSFAALPLFLIWLQMSWIIVLFGAEISFAQQNVDTYEFEPDCLKASHSFKKLLALRIVQLCVRHFSDGEKPPNADEISQKLDIPIRLVHQLIFELTESGILVEVKMNDHKDAAYHPARNVESLTIKEVVHALESRGIDDIPVEESQEMEKIQKALKAFGDLVESSDQNVVLNQI